MAVIVRLPTPLRRLAGGASEVQVSGSTVGQLLTELEAQHPGFHDRLFDEGGEIRRFVNIYVRGEDIRFQQGLDTSVVDGDDVSIVPAVAGGGHQ